MGHSSFQKNEPKNKIPTIFLVSHGATRKNASHDYFYLVNFVSYQMIFKKSSADDWAFNKKNRILCRLR